MKLSNAQISELRYAFNRMDVNKDGFVTKKELRRLFRELGQEVKEEVIDEMIAIADTNRDGLIDFDEFCNASKGKN